MMAGDPNMTLFMKENFILNPTLNTRTWVGACSSETKHLKQAAIPFSTARRRSRARYQQPITRAPPPFPYPGQHTYTLSDSMLQSSHRPQPSRHDPQNCKN
ncbi:hypothetical protein SLA2020_363780 [Shorea laevis]